MLRGTLVWLSGALLATAQISTSNTLLSVLSSNGLSGFQNYIGQYPALQQQLEQGNVTGMYLNHLRRGGSAYGIPNFVES